MLEDLIFDQKVTSGGEADNKPQMSSRQTIFRESSSSVVSGLPSLHAEINCQTADAEGSGELADGWSKQTVRSRNPHGRAPESPCLAGEEETHWLFPQTDIETYDAVQRGLQLETSDVPSAKMNSFPDAASVSRVLDPEQSCRSVDTRFTNSHTDTQAIRSHVGTAMEQGFCCGVPKASSTPCSVPRPSLLEFQTLAQPSNSFGRATGDDGATLDIAAGRDVSTHDAPLAEMLDALALRPASPCPGTRELGPLPFCRSAEVASHGKIRKRSKPRVRRRSMARRPKNMPASQSTAKSSATVAV